MADDLELQLNELLISDDELEAWILKRFGEHEHYVNRAAFLAVCEVQLAKTLNGVVAAIDDQNIKSAVFSPGTFYAAGFSVGVHAVKEWIARSLTTKEVR